MLKEADNPDSVTIPLGHDDDAVAPAPVVPPDDEVLVPLDVEWTSHPTRKYRNCVISYGLRIEQGERATDVIVYPSGTEWRHRITLTKALGRLIGKALDERVLDRWPKKLTLIMHYGRGDLAAFRDFKVLKTRVDSLKGTFATTKSPARLAVETDEKS